MVLVSCETSRGGSDTDTETEEWVTGFIQITCWFRQKEKHKKKWNKVQQQLMPEPPVRSDPVRSAAAR